MDKKNKMEVLEELMAKMGGRIAERDLKPRSKMVIKAEGDNPEEMKEEIIDKLKKIDLPDEEEVKEMESEVPKEMMEEEDDSYLDVMPENLKKAILKKLKK